MYPFDTQELEEYIGTLLLKMEVVPLSLFFICFAFFNLIEK